MVQITANNVNTSNRFLNLSRVESSIVSHMELSLYKTTCDNRTLKKTVMIFSGYEYTISFYDINSGARKNLTGLIDYIDEAGQYLTMKYKTTTTDSTSDADVSVTAGMPNCGCILNKPDTSKYSELAVVNIPVTSITDVVYVRGGTNPVPSRPKKGVKVVLLGISAEVVRAVAINLRMITDDEFPCEDAVKDINLKIGNIYNIAYLSIKDKAMYEFDGKLISIKETTKEPSKDTIVRANEQYGLNNSIYNSNCNCTPTGNTSIDDYLSSDVMKNDILLTFDTSTDFSGEYQTIMLSWIRDCKLVKEMPDAPSIDDSDNSTINPSCENCKIDMTTGQTPVSIYPASKVITYNHEGQSGEISFQELLDFYFCSC